MASQELLHQQGLGFVAVTSTIDASRSVGFECSVVEYRSSG